MGVIVIEGAVITLLVLTGFREAVLNAIPMDLKRAIGIGIGLFLAIIGLVNGGIVVGSPATLITLNPDLSSLHVLVFVFGLAVTSTLVARKVKGGLLIGILATTVFAIIVNQGFGNSAVFDTGIAVIPKKIVSSPDFSLLGNFNFGVFDVLGFATASAAILAVMLSDFFDTMGTVVGLADEANLLDEDGTLPGMNRVLLVDSLAAAAGGAASASSNTTYIESAAGIGEGGRTGLTAVVVGVLFLLAIFFSPIAGIIPPEATAPVLVIVGYFMMQAVGEITWRDPGDRHPGAADDRDDAVHVLHHERRRRGVPLLRRDQGAPGQVPRGASADVRRGGGVRLVLLPRAAGLAARRGLAEEGGRWPALFVFRAPSCPRGRGLRRAVGPGRRRGRPRRHRCRCRARARRARGRSCP